MYKTLHVMHQENIWTSLFSKQLQVQIPNLIQYTNPTKNGTAVYSSTVLLCNMHWTDSAENLKEKLYPTFLAP
jgi:hypothetical protein